MHQAIIAQKQLHIEHIALPRQAH